MRTPTLNLTMILVAIIVSACARHRGPLHHLAEGETQMLLLTLKSGDKHEFVIKSDEPIWLSLSTDASFEAMKKYRVTNPPPVRLEHRTKMQAISTVKGAGRVAFTPIDGAIPLRIVNETDEKLQILVYSNER